ncbi:MAG: DUF3148 domain-containing protein [Cyanobacteria bacterium QS_8_64_29]|jgi:hypothetical protein|nr:MAG: DUF3148 domain-containing protein [Cyanobacteria bacterium QS_8_64_29]
MPDSEPEFAVGERVQLVARPPYLKTADPMPMLRSADAIAVGEQGIVLERRPGGYWGVRFQQGAFLLEGAYLARAPAQA